MVGRRKFWLALVALTLGAAIAWLGFAYGKAEHVPPILYGMATLAGVFVAANAAEWVQRRKDGSTIVEQTKE